MDSRQFAQANNVNSKGFLSQRLVMLMKDNKIIRAECLNPPPFTLPAVWSITSMVREDNIACLSELPSFSIYPAWQNPRQEKEWGSTFDLLRNNKEVAAFKFDCYEIYILPPRKESKSNPATVKYIELSKRKHPMNKCNGRGSFLASTHPQYLKTLGQAHGWIFGAIAELIDNSMDAKATKVEIGISMVYSKTSGREVPMFGIIDNGSGMKHSDLQSMVQFGHGSPETENATRIGKFGIGFKTGAMRLGKDVLVLTQTDSTRSIAFLSQIMNEGNNNLEIPIVSYRWTGQCMEVDTNVQDADSAKHNLELIKKFSPFNKYLIGEKSGIFKSGIFNNDGKGTQIYIWNLDDSRSGLEWKTWTSENCAFNWADIYVRSKMIRSRAGQISKNAVVPLDYSLKSYLKLIYLDPRMKIYVQGALVDSRPLAKSLNQTLVENGNILGKPLELTLGYSQLEWEQENCGIFLYWHGRLIEAYKRVGRLLNNEDKGRGVIGVIDVTTLTGESNDDVRVDSNKQGFHRDCEPYVELEKWLGERVDAYLDKYVSNVELGRGNATRKPDHEWVQCHQCRKWRKIDTDFDGTTLSLEWFCHMKPFYKLCKWPEEKVQTKVITVSTKGSKDLNRTRDKLPESDSDDDSLVEISASDFHKQSKLKGNSNASEIPAQNKLQQKVNVCEILAQNELQQKVNVSEILVQNELQQKVNVHEIPSQNELQQNVNVSEIPAHNELQQKVDVSEIPSQNELQQNINVSEIPAQNELQQKVNMSEIPMQNKVKQEINSSSLSMENELHLNINASGFPTQNELHQNKQIINTSDIQTQNNQNNLEQSNGHGFPTQNKLKQTTNTRPARNQQKCRNNASVIQMHNKQQQKTNSNDGPKVFCYKRKQNINKSDISSNKRQRVSLPRACKGNISWKGLA